MPDVQPSAVETLRRQVGYERDSLAFDESMVTELRAEVRSVRERVARRVAYISDLERAISALDASDLV
jgi:hypothetical protein